jgi:diguanylate cyclase (GGDEF)-like protein
MDLIRNIQSESFKRNLVKSFVKLSEQHNLRLIAEGIESEEELKTLIQIGVRYGQGYFLGMPRAELSELSENVVKIIHNLNYVKKLSEGLVFSTVSTVINAFPSFQISTKTKVVKEFFDSNPNVTSVCILEGDSIVGMVGRFYLYAALSKMYAYDLYANKSIINLTFKSPTIIESSMKLHDAIDIAMNRSIKELYDDFIVINEGKYYGMVTIRNLLINVVDIERQHAVDMNPLTNLPGNKIINKKLDILSSITSDFSVVYFDLNNFKHFNDTYGFEVGDRIIKSFANILKETMMTNDLATSFLGYIGGDDFIVILDSNHDRTVEYINNVFSKFDEFYVNTFNHLESQVRTSIAAAGVFSETFNINLTGELLASKLAEIKKEAKMIRTHNNYVLRTL